MTKSEYLEALKKKAPGVDVDVISNNDRALLGLGRGLGLGSFSRETKVRMYTPKSGKNPKATAYADVDGPVVKDVDGSTKQLQGVFVRADALDYYITEMQRAKAQFAAGQIEPEVKAE